MSVADPRFRNLKELPDIYDRRMDASNKLEKAETALLRMAAKAKLKADKAAGKDTKQKEPTPARTKATTGMNGSGESLVVDGPLRTPSLHESAVARAEDFVPANKRPTHKLGFLGLFGEKVDTIEWCRKEIAECTGLLAEGRRKIRESDEKLKGEDADDALAGAAVDEYGNPITEEGRIRAFEEDGTLDVQGAFTGISGKVKNGVVGGVKGAVGGVKGAGGKVMSVGGKVVQGVTGKGGPDEYAPLSSAFVTFNKQISAHLALQALPHHKPYRMGE
jgi:calcium permeable stress-gated cation channel